MGVQGLWQIVAPVARPIMLESLEDKRLAIDAGIWLYQFQMATRDRKTGDTIHGAHIMGTFRRIMKLLFHGIRPVFVFDGDAPLLKKRTIEKRKRRKQGAGTDLAKTAQKLLSAQLRTVVAERELNKLRKEKLGGTAANAAASGLDTGEQIGSGAVYLEDLDKPASPVKPVRKDMLRDEYALPQIEGPLASRAKMSDPRIATEEELRDFIEDLRPEDLDIESDFFSNLPTEVKYEILGDLRIKTRQVNHRRVQQMRGVAAFDFSRAQIDHLMERNQYTQKLLSVTDELGKSAIAIPTRVAGSRNREYVLVKQDASKGGGWVLGVNNPEIYNAEPITIDTTTDESVDGHTDTDEFEEVAAPQDANVGLPTPDVQARRALAEEAVRVRFAATAPGPVADPYLDQPVASTSRGAGLFQEDAPVDQEDVLLQHALYESTQTAEAHIMQPVSFPPRATLTSAPPSRPPAASSRTNAMNIPGSTQSRQSSRDGARTSETNEDDFEYVSPSADSSGMMARDASCPPEGVPSVVLETDGEESDAFEEVASIRPLVSASARQSTSPTANAPAPARLSVTPHVPPPKSTSLADASAPSPTPIAVSRYPSPSPARSHPPSPSLIAPTRTLFDSMLPSDSDSDNETSPPKPPVAPLPPLLPPARGLLASGPPGALRLSPSPDPFERFEQAGEEQGQIEARDFASLPSRALAPPSDCGRSSSSQTERPMAHSPHHARTSERVGDSVPSPRSLSSANPPKAGEANLLAVPPVSAALPIALQAQIDISSPASPQAEAGRASSPVDMPSPLPLLEKAQEAVQAEEADSLPSTIDQLQSPPPADAKQDVAMAEARAAAKAFEGPETVAQDEDELFFSEWSRSPTPPPREGNITPRTADEQDSVGQAEWYYDLDDEQEAEALQVLEREEEAFADVMAQLRNEKIEKMRVEAEKDIQRLSEQRNVEMRNADGITRQMAIDIKEMLILFGIPYVEAPMEAEAECASLLARQLVDGIVTDDSDVFLFGGSRIYRHMFNERKYVECYLLADLEREIGLDRDKLVRLAYLLGSDYTEGLPGVGPVVGRELLEEFPGKNGLVQFKQWWDRVQGGKDSEFDTNSAWRRRFKKGHKDLILDKGWPHPEVAEAYYRPTVVDSDEQFSWGGVDLDGLRFFLNRALGWDQSKTDSLLLPLIKRDRERKAGAHRKQPVMTDFFDYTVDEAPLSRKRQPKYASKRLQNVVQQWKDKSQPRSKVEDEVVEDQIELAEEDRMPSIKKKRSRKASITTVRTTSKKKSATASRKRTDRSDPVKRGAVSHRDASSDERYGPNLDKADEAGSVPSRTRTQPARGAAKKTVSRSPTTGHDEDYDQQ